eukprot:XP_017953306.1 PREDICTED: protein FAM65C [Xenopus tropicalis]
MSVKLRFSSPSDGLGGVGRSRSFAGFSTLQVRKTSQSLRRSSVRSKVLAKSDKLYPSLRKGSIPLDPHPHQVKKIFEALRKGLNEYLEEHQTQLDFLAGQQKDIKRNSRLAYFYDLDKEIRLIERHIRKLEFHISKIEELYETYCIQWRLRVGACNMKHAFSLSPSTKASRESLLELYKNFQECTEDMCTIEGELEVHLGEFLIKMKGLVGYARLCPGDHYEVLIKLGRQRWRLKGKIETDDSQMWDEEERMFIPNLCENFEIKVVELRGLTTIVVGLVTCHSADFFTTRPRIIIVDITELGTIKLQLEVIWKRRIEMERLDAILHTVRLFHNLIQPRKPSIRLTSRSLFGRNCRHKARISFSMGIFVPQHHLFTNGNFSSFRRSGHSCAGIRTFRIRSLLKEFIAQAADLGRGLAQSPDSTATPISSLTFSSGVRISVSHDHGPFLLCIFVFIHMGGRCHTVSMFYLLSIGTIQERALTSIGCNTNSTPSEASTGNEDLDLILSLHLRVCKALLKKLTWPNTARILQNHLLEELCWQKEVLDYLSLIFIQKAGDNVSTDEVIPKAKKIRHFLKLWKSCTSPDCPWFCASETFLSAVKKMFAGRIKRKYPGQLETVCRRVLEQMFTFGGVFPANELSDGVVSIFLVYGYLRRHQVLDLEKYIAALTREVTLIEDLQLPGRLKKIKKLKAKQIYRLQPLPQLLRILANFQLDENKKLSKASANFLSRASTNKQFKHKAVLYYTEVLSGDDTTLQRSACLALKHLKGTASIDQIACLCQSEVEEVRNIARDTILSFGMKGCQAFGKTDKMCRELQDTLTLDGEIEITVF